MRKRKLQFTSSEADLAFQLAASLDPARYLDPEVKALILKCKAYVSGEYDGGRIR